MSTNLYLQKMFSQEIKKNVIFQFFPGCRGPRQNPSFMATLLRGHAGPHFRCGLRRPGPHRRGQAGAAQDHQRQRNEGRHHTHLRQQAGFAGGYEIRFSSLQFLIAGKSASQLHETAFKSI